MTTTVTIIWLVYAMGFMAVAVAAAVLVLIVVPRVRRHRQQHGFEVILKPDPEAGQEAKED